MGKTNAAKQAELDERLAADIEAGYDPGLVDEPEHDPAPLQEIHGQRKPSKR